MKNLAFNSMKSNILMSYYYLTVVFSQQAEELFLHAFFM